MTACIVGWAHTPFGKLAGETVESLIVKVATEALADAGVAAGLSRELSDRLARATVSGAGELLYRSKETPAKLRENVTSPAGTTFAALQILRPEEGFPSLLRRAVAAAAARSRELAG